MCGRDGACVIGRHVWQGGVCGKGCMVGGHAWQGGVWQGVCMARGVHV